MAVETSAQAAGSSLAWKLAAWLTNGRRRLALLAIVTALVVAVYALVNHTLGFPLDDAWIHQDFARTLAQQGVFAYAPDRSGAGSTSPLWVLLLTPAQLVPGGAPLWLVVAWADVLGTLALFGLAWAVGVLVELWLADAPERLRALGALVAGIAVIAEWHLTWAALSGMETMLFVFISVLLLVGVGRIWHPAWLGLLAALLTSIRPEGSVLALLIAGALALGSVSPAGSVSSAWAASRHWRSVLIFLGVYALGLLPLLVFNELASGSLLPSTFYAKGAYYALEGSELTRLASYGLGVLGWLFSSPLVVLGLPGAVYALWQARRTGPRSPLWLAALWALALIAVYAVHLPVIYQNGRYLMLVLPVLLALGMVGYARLLNTGSYRLLPGVLFILALALGMLSLVRGAGIYTANIRYINDYQVATAFWLRDHTPSNALVATHDIGAIGYFSGRRVIDLGGLTQPEIIPLLSDQQALVAYLQQAHVGYVVMFPDWFPPPRLLLAAVQHGEVYRAHDPAIAAIGGSDLVTYQTGWDGPSGKVIVNAPHLVCHKTVICGILHKVSQVTHGGADVAAEAPSALPPLPNARRPGLASGRCARLKNP